MKYKVRGNYLILEIDALYRDKSIAELFTKLHLSKKMIHLLKQNKEYMLNNKFVSSEHRLKEKDILKIKAFNDEGIDFIPQEHPLDIAYEDEFILIVDKPIHTAIYPEHKDGLNTLCNYVANYYLETNQYLPVRHIHRLDQDTSGLVLFCKCPLIQPYLDNMMASKQIKRTYIAIVQGIINNNLEIDAKIARDRHENRMRVSKNGQRAITNVKVLAKNKKDNYTVVRCDLQTGRKHQIRVHLASINRPLLSDPIYGNNSNIIKRVALHAYRLELIHPITQEKIIAYANIPKDMHFIKKIEIPNM